MSPGVTQAPPRSCLENSWRTSCPQVSYEPLPKSHSGDSHGQQHPEHLLEQVTMMAVVMTQRPSAKNLSAPSITAPRVT